ncbi:MAG: DUF368 domain-containing protein [Tannerellaceae bacterium]|nr:DUF368 domain-containing protein [Tannerellaceae bacterium]
MEKRSLKDYVLIALKGAGMGAADVVPGVSGGTIAFIVGIYEELLDSIKSINLSSLKLLFTGKIAAFWKAINGNFLFSLVIGIAFSIFSLAKLITWLLANQPILVWSFFFGLVMASTWIVSKDVRSWNWKTILCFIAGAVVAYFITAATPVEQYDTLSLWYVFLAAMIAICAMILPGISGSFVLVLLGGYKYVMEAVKNLDIVVILVFVCGAAIGITSFARLLSFALKRFHDITISILAGFMLGSLNKVWPWKELETGTNILPNELVWQGLLLIILGFGIVWGLERISSSGTAKKKLPEDLQ